MTLAQAIAKQEGAKAALNNPGNLTGAPSSFCQNGKDSRGLVIFCSEADGEAALQHQIDLNTGRGLTLEEFFAGKPGVYPGYANAAAGNDPATYAANVSRWTGIPADVPLSSVDTSGGLAPALASASVPDVSATDGSGFDLTSVVDFSNPLTWAAVGLALFLAVKVFKI